MVYRCWKRAVLSASLPISVLALSKVGMWAGCPCLSSLQQNAQNKSYDASTAPKDYHQHSTGQQRQPSIVEAPRTMESDKTLDHHQWKIYSSSQRRNKTLASSQIFEQTFLQLDDSTAETLIVHVLTISRFFFANKTIIASAVALTT